MSICSGGAPNKLSKLKLPIFFSNYTKKSCSFFWICVYKDGRKTLARSVRH